MIKIKYIFNRMIKLREMGREFNIIFRTFGIDLPEVLEEFNVFCMGEHPLYPDIKMPEW